MATLETLVLRDGHPAPSLTARVVGAVREGWRSLWLGPHSTKDPALARLFGGEPVASGVQVNEDSALDCSALFVRVTLIAGDISSLPLHYYRKLADGGKQRWDDHPTATVLTTANAEMSIVQVLDAWIEAALLYEAGYIEIVRDGAGRPAELWPIMPWRVQPYRERGQLFYRVAGEGGSDVVLSPRDLLILRGPTLNGVTGHPTVQRARQAIGATLAAERFAAGFFGRGSTFGGLLSHPRVLGEKAAKNLRESIEAMHRGPDQAHRFAILEEGITFTKLGVDPDHAQMIESRTFQLAEVARYYHVPPSKLGQLEDSNHSTIEAETAAYFISCIRPWVTRIEAELNLKLVPSVERHRQRIEFTLEGFLRADTATRAAFYATMSSHGLMTQNEIRALEHLPPVPGGDQLFKPLMCGSAPCGLALRRQSAAPAATGDGQMSRRTEPAPLPPRYRAERAPDGAWRVGPSPSMPCSSCSGWFDPGLYAACPFCDTLADETEQQHMADLAQWALEVATVNDSIH